MKHLFIINPAAGQRESTENLEKQIRALPVDWEIVYTANPGDAVRFARNAAHRCRKGQNQDRRKNHCTDDGGRLFFQTAPDFQNLRAVFPLMGGGGFLNDSIVLITHFLPLL